MANIALKDILIGARQEAYRMRHFYVGAEHLFIALLEIRGSLASSIVQEHGLTPEYVIDAIRRKIGKGGKQRLWAGVPNTPRTDVVLGIANDLALEAGREEINERDILIALFEEQDSVPLRVLRALGLHNLGELVEMARHYTLNIDSQQPYVKMEYGNEFDPSDPLSKEHQFLLRRMFYGYQQLRVERRLTGGYSNAVLLLVTPLQLGDREDAPVVVKINRVDRILDEAQRYETHVKTRLPSMTAHIDEKPVAPETSDLAGIKYSLVAGADRVPRDLRAVMHNWTPEQLGDWLAHELFPTFGRIWWTQNRPYRFQVWQEYDWLLPPILTLDYNKDATSAKANVLKMPIKRAMLRRLDFGDSVIVENFIVHRVYPERNAIQLAIVQGTDSTTRAYKIEMRGVNLRETTFYRGEVVESIAGTVWQTRNQQLLNALRMLEPDFDPAAERIRMSDTLSLPNPVLAYEGLLDSYVNGSMSTIHGDLHPGNIMLGPKQSAFLIDFAHTRDGHTVFDWACLESSLLSDYIAPLAGTSWEDMRQAMFRLMDMNGGAYSTEDDSPINEGLVVLSKIRLIVEQCLAVPNTWAEYHVALAFSTLRALTWDTVSIPARRLLFLVSALAIHELRTRHRPTSSTETPSPDDTEHI